MNPNEPQKLTDVTPATSSQTSPPNATNIYTASQEPANQAPVSAPNTGNNGKTHQGARDLLSIVAIFVSALLLAFVLISFVFQSYQVDGPSMQGALNNNDHLIVWKIPRTLARITHHTYIPDRGDIVIFNAPSTLAEFGAGSDKQLIKRVVGLPGDRIVVNNGVITVYNKANPKGFDPDKTMPYNQDGHIPITTGNIDLTLGPGQIFVCGDNRTDSLDSRAFGPISGNSIVGKLVVRVLPISDFKNF